MGTPQQELVARAREFCRRDERLTAALTYGSVAQGRDDEHSDVEFWIFTADAAFDRQAWCDQLGPHLAVLHNEFGALVCIYSGLLRAEFHFAPFSELESQLSQWPARGAAVDRMVILDRTGALHSALERIPLVPQLPDANEQLAMCERFADWLLLAHHVNNRGEHLRSVDALGHAQRYLLWMTRFATDRTQNWLTPSRCAESDLSPETVAILSATSAPATAIALNGALRTAWQHGRSCWEILAARHGRDVPSELFAALDSALS